MGVLAISAADMLMKHGKSAVFIPHSGIMRPILLQAFIVQNDSQDAG
jgi:hypothetical protein